MAQFMGGIVLIFLLILALVAAAVFRPPYWAVILPIAIATLLIPGIILVVLGQRRIALFTKVGRAVLTAARETGQVNIVDISTRTQTDLDDVRRIVTTLSKTGAIPRNVEVS